MKKTAILGLVLGGVLATGPLSYVFAETASSTPEVATSTPSVRGSHCMQGVVKKRDTALIAGIEAFSLASVEAISAREEALGDAWGISTIRERNKALRSAWESFKNNARTAKRALRANHEAVWKQFKVDSRACGSSVLYDSNDKSSDAILL